MEKQRVIVRIPATEITIPYEELNCKRLEEELLETLKQSGRRAFNEVISFVDNEEHTRRLSGLMSCGKSGNWKYVQTVFGDVRFSRRRYREESVAGSRYLVDEKLGLEKRQQASPGKQKAEIESAVDARSYRKAAAEEVRWSGLSRSHESIRQLVIKEGQRIKDEQEAQIRAAEVAAYRGNSNEMSKADTTAESPVYVEADSIYVAKQRRKKAGKKRGIDGHGKKEKIEIKLGIVYRGHAARYEGGQGNQRRLKEKQVYVGVNEPAESFMKKFSIVCEMKHMISRAGRVIVGGDGAEWIKNGMKDYFVNGVYVLCKYHLNRALKRALGYHKLLEKQIRQLLKRDRISACIGRLTEVLQNTTDLSSPQIKKLKDLRSYIASNAEGINAIERLKKELEPAEQTLIRRTGAIEGNIDKVIAQRMKGKGMSWSVRGGEAMVQVISKRTNDEWHSWWVGGRDHKMQVCGADYEALEMVSFWKKQEKHQPVIPDAGLPALYGAHQDRAWAHMLRDLSDGQHAVR